MSDQPDTDPTAVPAATDPTVNPTTETATAPTAVEQFDPPLKYQLEQPIDTVDPATGETAEPAEGAITVVARRTDPDGSVWLELDSGAAARQEWVDANAAGTPTPAPDATLPPPPAAAGTPTSAADDLPAPPAAAVAATGEGAPALVDRLRVAQSTIEDAIAELSS